jgi:hypothetical protein
MRLAIDKTDLRFELHLRKAGHLDGDVTVGRTYSALTLEQLRVLYYNTTGHNIECLDYNATLQACKHLAERLLTAAQER